MTQDSNAGERNEPESAREPTAEEIKAAKEAQDMADGHRYMSQEMRDARDAQSRGDRGGDKPKRKDAGPKTFKDDKPGGKGGAKAPPAKTERIAKVLARAGLASRREVERLIGLGKIAVNGRILETPAVLVSTADVITVEGQVIGKAEPTRLFRYHKPVGLVTTHRDPQGRPTVFDKLPQPLPRVISVGRLDLNSEGLLLLTNDGELARALELPSSGWVRRYRARALGHTTQARLDALKDGTTVEGVIYGPIEATLDKVQDKADGRANVWITVAITEGKNREVRKVLESIGLKVNRLIRLAYGPFQLGNLEPGEVEEVGPRVIRELLADKIDPRNLPLEGASQTQDAPKSRSRFSRDTTGGAERGAGERRGSANRFADSSDRPSARPASKRPAFMEKAEYRERDFDERPRFEGDGTARDRRPEGDRPKRDYGDKPRFDRAASGEGAPRKSYGDKPRFDRAPPSEDRPKRAYGDKPRFDRSASGEGAPREGAPRKSYGDKPRFDRAASGDDSPKRAYGDKPRFDRAASGDDRPKRAYGDKPRFDRAASGEGAPRKSYSDKPRFDRAASNEDRPKRAYGDKPRFDRAASSESAPRKSYGDKPRFDRAASGDDRPKKTYGDKPRFDRAASGEDRPKRAYSDKPGFARSEGAERPKRDFAPRGEGGERSGGYKGAKPGGGGFKGGKPSGGGFKSGGARPGGKPGGFGDRKPPRDRG